MNLLFMNDSVSETRNNNNRRHLFTPTLFFVACSLYMVLVVNMYTSSSMDSVVGWKDMMDEFKNDFLRVCTKTNSFNNKHSNCNDFNVTVVPRPSHLHSRLLKLSTKHYQQEKTKTSIIPPSISKHIGEGRNDDFVENNMFLVHERPPMKGPPPIYVAIPSVPRAQNVDYLMQVLESMETKGFPMANIYVFYNGNPNHRTHHRWNEAEMLYSYKGVSFVWNDSPVPKPHPSTYNTSFPVPMKITDYALWEKERKRQEISDIGADKTIRNTNETIHDSTLTDVADRNNNNNSTNDDNNNNVTYNSNSIANTDSSIMASTNEEGQKIYETKWLPRIQKAQTEDARSRIDWRRKECNDFRIIMQHMVQNVVYKDVDIFDYGDVYRRNNSWIIFNQDDSTFNYGFRAVWELLDREANTTLTRHDFWRDGLVSAAFRARHALELLERPWAWCDLFPVDWMLWALEDIYESGTSKRSKDVVNHIGKVSSKHGRVEESKYDDALGNKKPQTSTQAAAKERRRQSAAEKVAIRKAETDARKAAAKEKEARTKAEAKAKKMAATERAARGKAEAARQQVARGSRKIEKEAAVQNTNYTSLVSGLGLNAADREGITTAITTESVKPPNLSNGTSPIISGPKSGAIEVEAERIATNKSQTHTNDTNPIISEKVATNMSQTHINETNSTIPRANPDATHVEAERNATNQSKTRVNNTNVVVSRPDPDPDAINFEAERNATNRSLSPANGTTTAVGARPDPDALHFEAGENVTNESLTAASGAAAIVSGSDPDAVQAETRKMTTNESAIFSRPNLDATEKKTQVKLLWRERKKRA